MRKITLFAVAAAVIATGVFGVWAASPTNARVPSLDQGINPHQMMMNARALPATEFADYTFVFR
jgi:negative regulator of sigma E activity